MDSELNRSQTVVPFGVGAIYDYLNYTAISLSVDDWDILANSNSFHALKINNPRLQYFVNKKLKDLQKNEYVWVQYFLNPPIKKERGMPRELNDIFYPMPVKKFPEYYVCTRCGHLSKPHPTSNEKARCNNPSTPAQKTFFRAFQIYRILRGWSHSRRSLERNYETILCG